MQRSDSITTLAAALVKFSGKMVKVAKDSTNPHFKNKYASLSTIIEATQKPLSECGLTIIQMPSGDNQLETILLHESGEFISEMYRMTPSKNDPQGLGSAITYQRRYAYGAILNLNIDEDDDGNKASEPAKKQPEVKPLPELTPSHKNWSAAVIAVRSGQYKIEDVLKKYVMSPATLKQFEQEVINLMNEEAAQ